jgi:hypothetical protein
MRAAESAEADTLDVGPANPAIPPEDHALFILPARRGDGLLASVRGRVIVLADPAADPFAPTADELLILSIASELAWSARRFLTAQGQATDVSLAVTWQTVEDPPRVADISVTVTAPPIADALRAALQSELEKRAAVRSPRDPLRVHLSCQG